MSGRVVHFELPFDDGARARSFYADLFGWQLQDVPGMDYSLVMTGPVDERGSTEPGYINGGMTQRGGPVERPVVTIDVDDIDATLAAVAERGGSTLVERQPVGDMGWTAYFSDPEGNVMGLWQTAARQGEAPQGGRSGADYEV
ncbi:VOC family protein [Knoellia sp. p5-6-4]|uniref:VOC family protein n=1 Tax=unclassified Knoellia TaxID=2618719 RepID=UPI0023DA5FE6|nr:VOC family protein [Knoellia sp. p5-6-4]MDF2146710.1 VOC family protein [Knoellia sp. p5-6-4]